MVNDVLKIQAMKMVMKNPKLVKLVLDAIKSPVGSTKRDQAKNVLKSVITAQTNRFQRSYPVLPMPQQAPTKGGGQGGGNAMAFAVPVPAQPKTQSRKVS